MGLNFKFASYDDNVHVQCTCTMYMLCTLTYISAYTFRTNRSLSTMPWNVPVVCNVILLPLLLLLLLLLLCEPRINMLKVLSCCHHWGVAVWSTAVMRAVTIVVRKLMGALWVTSGRAGWGWAWRGTTWTRRNVLIWSAAGLLARLLARLLAFSVRHGSYIMTA